MKPVDGTIARARRLLGGLLLALLTGCGSPEPPVRSGPIGDWPAVGNTLGGLKYSPLDQIHKDNVGALEVAWVHHSGDVSDGTGDATRTAFQATPIVVDDTLYYCTGFNRVFALDPETGDERWVFDPKLRATRLQGPYPLTCRGVDHWRDPEPAAVCQARIFTGTIDSELIALDAATGQPCPDFGRDGRVALREGVGDAPTWEYYSTSPPLVVRDVVVVGALVADSLRVDAPSGVVRGFDARTGALRWAFDPVPPWWPERGEEGGGYQSGTPNVWSLLAGDEERGLVFIPTGNASPDSFGAIRRGLDHYASSTVALDVETGAVVWAFQTVHRDVWDYDVASQPALFQIEGVGGGAPALAQATKMGHVFLLHRETGKPLYPVEERPVPQGGVPGEVLSPTQPFPTHPPPLHPASLRPDDVWGFTFVDRGDCADKLRHYRNEGIFTPPSLEGSIQYPGPAGGANWGGVAIDPERGVLYVNQTRAGVVHQLVPRAEFDSLDPASVVYPEELYPMAGAPYGVRRSPLLSNFGAPCNPPPWGTLTAVDLRSGQVLWESTLGTTRDQAPWPLWLDNGAPNLGGSIVTAGGVVFVGATTDKFLRGFDADTGEEIWTARLPYTGNATPMTYRLRPDSRQFVVIAAGGHGWSEPGDALTAYALPVE
ncbi:MAG: pyrroloquinoline quinone-dependent dehydrogenase [Proteobacteria bacterium]|nr:pyrroloquinoline quinone-dependent dehydrogenase [Pseudomonadota bacterium]